MRFQATIVLTGKTACGIRVPEAVVTSLGSSRRPPVRVMIKGYTYRTTIAPMGGENWIGVSAENREAAGVKAGEDVSVDVELDTEPRVLAVPPDLAAALDREPRARAFFDSLSYSNKRRFVLPVEAAKTAGTRQRRIETSVAALKEGRV